MADEESDYLCAHCHTKTITIDDEVFIFNGEQIKLLKQYAKLISINEVD